MGRWLSGRGEWDLELFVAAIPYEETRNYVQKVLGRWYVYRWLYLEGAAAERIPYVPLGIPARVRTPAG